MELSTPTADDYSNRAWALLNLGRFEEAAVDYSRAIDRHGPPTPVSFGLQTDLRNRGKCFFRLGRYGEALRDFAAAFEIQPRTADAMLLYQSQTLERLGRREEAEAALVRARKRKPDVEVLYGDWLASNESACK
jgi:tetratricopeptide (TPR) repeat protein